MHLPAPVIQPLRHTSKGTKITVGPNTYIEIRSDAPATRIYFTTDGTKPDPFQKGRTGKASSHKYIGPFRLQVGNRVVRAIVVSRDRLRESPVTTKYIDVVPDKSEEPQYAFSDNEHNESSYSDEEPNEFVAKFPVKNNKPEQPKTVMRQSYSDLGELQGSVEGPINPVNYHGTQINVWGFPHPELANFLQPKQEPQPALGYLTDQMIRNLNTPRAIEPKPQNDMANVPENLRKLFKQLQKLYERDSDFQNNLDYLIDNAQLKWAAINERHDAFEINIHCPKFLVTEPERKPPSKPKQIIKQRPVSPEVQIYDDPKPPVKEEPKPAPPPKVVIPKPAPQPKVIPPSKPDPPKPTPPPPKPTPPPPKPIEPEIYIEENIQQGTLVDAPNFNSERDAEALRNAVKGLGTKESVIINIMGNRSNSQRLKIKDAYKLMFGKELSKDLEGDTSGNFKKILVSLLYGPVEFDCHELRKAVKGLGTDDSALVEILTSRSNKRIQDMSRMYFELFNRKMEDDVQGDTSGHYRKLLNSLMTANRPETNEVDMHLVRSDVDELIKAGVKKWGTDESKFNAIFGIRSYAHLRKVFDEYEVETKKPIEDAIRSEMSGNLAKTYLALIANIRNKPGYFAKEIKKSIKGLGTDEAALNRIIISRCEVDLKQVKEEYQKIFNSPMEKDVKGDVSGDYGKLLLLLMLDPSERTYEDEGGDGAPEEPHIIETVEEPPIEQTGTLLAAEPFNPNGDCERLRKAMKGLGTDEKTIIEILTKRSNPQRQLLKITFTQMFGRDLVKDLKSETSGNFWNTLEALMMSPDEFDAFSYRKAIAGLGTDEAALVELLTTRTPEQITTVKAKYKSMYNKELESDIKSDTSGHFKHVLVSLLTAARPSGNTVDKTQAKIDATALFNAGTKKWGTDESKFVTILCSRSYPQLRATFDEYETVSGKPIEEDLKKECSGDLLKVFLSIVGCVRDYQLHFATLLYNSMKGLGTKDSTLIRIVVSRCEVDMVQIKQKFQQSFNKSLRDSIKSDTSGDFMKTLISLIGE